VADSLSAATARLSLAKTSADPEPSDDPLGGKKRWLSGRGNAKRRKLEENTRLRSWLEEAGVWMSEAADWGRQSSPVAMAIETREQGENEVSGRGLVARRSINLYEEICRVPLNLLLTRRSAQDIFGEECVPEYIGEYGAIALHLIHEKYVKDEESFWEPYIAVLPDTEEIGSSFSWADEELDMLLNGSNLLYQSKFLKSKITDEFKRLQDEIFAKSPSKFPSDAFTLENYIWAYSILFSRAVRLDFPTAEKTAFQTPGEIVALVPYVDLINHNPSSDTYIKGYVDGVQLPFGMTTTQADVVVSADRYYGEYEQIYISYGDKSNSQLLMLYGFSMERNPKNFAEVSLGHLMDDAPLAEAKRNVLRMRGITDEVFPLYRDRYTNEMIAYLRLMVLEPEDIILAEGETYEKALYNMEIFRAFGETSERRAMFCLKTICEDLLASYPNTLEQDEGIITDRGMFELLPKNQRNALRVRYGEKLILRGTITTVDRVLNNLGKLTEIQQEEGKRYRKMKNTMWGRLGFDFDNPAIKASNLEELMKELDI